MNGFSLIIAAGRGNMKAWKIERTNTDRIVPLPIFSLVLPEAAERFAEKFTDQAGSFPHGTLGTQGNSVAERMTLVTEEEMRSFRRLGLEITNLLRRHQNPAWAFAAPAEIHGAILDRVSPEVRKSIACHCKSDLVHTPTDELLSHFESE